MAPRNVLPQANAGQIELDGFHNIRFWGDASARDIQAVMMGMRRSRKRRCPLEPETSAGLQFLAISGGAEDGAFGAGCWSAGATLARGRYSTWSRVSVPAR